MGNASGHPVRLSMMVKMFLFPVGWGALPFNRLLDMHLQDGSVLCICTKASNLSNVSGFGIVVDSWESLGEISGCGIEVALGKVCCVQLLVLKVGPSVGEAVNMFTDVDIEVGFTNHERQSAALFWLQKSIQK